MKILIGILTCRRDRDWESRLRQYWVKCLIPNEDPRDSWKRQVNYKTQEWEVDYKFFLGKPEEKRNWDEIILNVSDGPTKQSVIDKIREMIRYAFNGGYDFLFKCDIDTYVHVPRLLKSGFENHDWSGYGEPYGGSGYWLSRKAMACLLEHATPFPTPESEDSWACRNLKNAGFVSFQDPRYHSRINKGPEKGNDLITSHQYMDGDRIIGFKERLSQMAKLHSRARQIKEVE